MKILRHLRAFWGAASSTRALSFVKKHWLPLTSATLLVVSASLVLAAYWQPWVSDPITSSQQTSLARGYHFAEPHQTANSQLPTPAKATREGQVFARVTVPRFGDGWVRLVGQGVMWHPTLNEIGIGHYRQTQMPGEVGNFAIAAHRGGFGGTFRNIDQLQSGDKVFVETRDAIYTYRYLQTKIVKPNDINTISKAPRELIGARKGAKYMTMTSCYPTWVNTHRIVVWLELVKTDLKVSNNG
jgi:sortase A